MMYDKEIELTVGDEFELRDSTIAFSAVVNRIEDGKAFVTLSNGATGWRNLNGRMYEEVASGHDLVRKVIQYYDFD